MLLAERPSIRRPEQCVVEFWLALLGHRWNALILWHLSGGAKRHGALMELLPAISTKILSERLDDLCGLALVSRTAAATYPRSVTYRLTEKGRELVAVLDRLDVWAHRHGSA